MEQRETQQVIEATLPSCCVMQRGVWTAPSRQLSATKRHGAQTHLSSKVRKKIGPAMWNLNERGLRSEANSQTPRLASENSHVCLQQILNISVWFDVLWPRSLMNSKCHCLRNVVIFTFGTIPLSHCLYFVSRNDRLELFDQNNKQKEERLLNIIINNTESLAENNFVEVNK